MKKRNEDDPDNLGGLGGMLPAEVLKMLNEMLERLHQTDHINQGSKIEVIFARTYREFEATLWVVGDASPSVHLVTDVEYG